MRKLFTSESVTEGHPDKMADQISDGILDAILEKDPMARVACETFLTTGMALIAGEISTNLVYHPHIPQSPGIFHRAANKESHRICATLLNALSSHGLDK